jgi:hypothetical protein
MNEATTNGALEQTHITVGLCVPSALFVSLRLRCTPGRDIPRCGTSAAPTAQDSSARGNAPGYTGLLEIACPEGAQLGHGPLHPPHRQPVRGLPPVPGRVLPFQGGTRLGDRVFPGRVPWAEEWCAVGAAGVGPDHRLRASRDLSRCSRPPWFHVSGRANQPVEATATRRMRFAVGTEDCRCGLGRRASPFRSEEASREMDQTRKSDRIDTINKIQIRTRHQEASNPVNPGNPVSLGNESRQQYVDIPVLSTRPTCPVDLDLPASRAEFPNQPVEATATRRMRFVVGAGDILCGVGRRASPFRSAA